jgi:hypothetical protein
MRLHNQSGFYLVLSSMYGLYLARLDQIDWLVAARLRGTRQRSRTQAGKTPAGGKGSGTAKSYGLDLHTMLDMIFKRDKVFDHIGVAPSG